MSAWKPTRDEAEFVGQVFAIDAGLAGIVRDQLKNGIPLREVIAGFKAAIEIARIAKAGAA